MASISPQRICNSIHILTCHISNPKSINDQLLQSVSTHISAIKGANLVYMLSNDFPDHINNGFRGLSIGNNTQTTQRLDLTRLLSIIAWLYRTDVSSERRLDWSLFYYLIGLLISAEFWISDHTHCSYWIDYILTYDLLTLYPVFSTLVLSFIATRSLSAYNALLHHSIVYIAS